MVLANKQNVGAGSGRNFGLRNKLAPPPKTSTLRRLEKMLDEKPKKRKKPTGTAVAPPPKDTPVTMPVSMVMAQPPRTPHHDALAFRGGLASVPTFRKAKIPPRKKTCLENKSSIPMPPSQKIQDTSSSTSSHVPAKSCSTQSLTLSDTLYKTLDRPRSEPPFLAPSPPTKTTHGLLQSAKNQNSLQRHISDCGGNRNPLLDIAVDDVVATDDDPIQINNEEIHKSDHGVTPPCRQIGLKIRKFQKEFVRNSVGNFNIQVSQVKEATDQQEMDEDHLLPTPLKASQVSDTNSASLPVVASKDSHSSFLSSNIKDSTNVLRTTKINHSSSTNSNRTRRSSATVNDNFVRLNLKNAAGACRGARNKKTRRKTRYQKDYGESNHEAHSGDEDQETTTIKGKSAQGQMYVSRMSGRDPLDDFLDGVFGNGNGTTGTKKVNGPKNTSSNKDDIDVPCCPRHQRPCKLLVVKKNTTGNKGRKFFACSLPRGENCDYFQWAEDTVEAARQAVANNARHSSFVARQVAAHVDRFRNLTVPELQNEATRRGLNKNGKKSQLLLRLALWARDEIVNAIPYPDDEEDTSSKMELTLPSSKSTINPDGQLSASDDDSSSSDSSVEELELFHHDLDQLEDVPTSHDDSDQEEEELMLEDMSPRSKLLSNLKLIFGYSEFREGQEWAIERCMAGKRSLLVAPTGFGKSLCYALPAALMDGVCVVVSPLISLIQDQLRSLPPRIPAATLSGSLFASDTASILDDVARNRIKILFVSPERLTSPSFRRLFCPKWNTDTQQHERAFPEISILCVDEAHCVSQWAHNFRPCFLRFKGLLQLMKPQSILAVTATAGDRVIQDICHTLGIPSKSQGPSSSTDSEDSILIVDKSRDNIDVNCQFVKSDDERLKLLTTILKPKPSENSAEMHTFVGALAKGSAIVYVWRQRDTEIAAEALLAAGVKGGVVIYHGGMDANARSKAQSKFMRGKARICVATVAFGMGIDKADVEGIIHLNLPSSPEHYLQEIGRAGRDGRQAQAIAIPSLDEIPIRHSLVHSNFLAKSQIRALIFALRRAVLNCQAEDNPLSCNVALPVEEIVIECDCKVETIETLLSILEQHGGDNPLFHVEGFNYDKATMVLKKRTLDKLAETVPVASSIQRVGTCFDTPKEQQDDNETNSQQRPSFQRHFLAYGRGSYTFSVAKCANALGPSAECRHVFAALRRLQSCGEIELVLDTSSNGRVLLLNLSNEGSSFFNSVDFDIHAEDIVDRLHDSFSSSIFSAASKVLDMSHILDSMATAATNAPHETSGPSEGKSPSLLKFQALIREYFSKGLQKETEKESQRILGKRFFSVDRRELESDLFALLQDLPILTKKVPDSDFAPILGKVKFGDYTVVAAAKFLHGLDSARAPTSAFRGHFLFGKWKHTNFRSLLDAIEKLVLVKDSRAI